MYKMNYNELFIDKKYGELLSSIRLPDRNQTSVFLHINNYCNYECPYCGYNVKSQEIKFDYDIRKLKMFFTLFLDKIHKERKLRFVITGGETTLYPNLVELCEYLYNKKVDYIRLNTNGSGDLNLYKQLMKYNVALHITYHPQANCYNNLMKLTEYLISENYTNWDMNVLLIKLPNKHEKEIFKFLNTPIINYGYIRLQDQDYYSEGYTEYLKYFKDNDTLEAKYKLEFENKTLYIKEFEVLNNLITKGNFFKGMYCNMYSDKIRCYPDFIQIQCFEDYYPMTIKGIFDFIKNYEIYKYGKKCNCNTCYYDCMTSIYKHRELK